MGNGCWADNDGDGELLSLVYNRCQTTSVSDTHNAKEPKSKEKCVQGSSTSSSHDLGGVKRYLECSEIYSLIDQLEGSFTQTFVNVCANNKLQDGVSDQHGECRTFGHSRSREIRLDVLGRRFNFPMPSHALPLPI